MTEFILAYHGGKKPESPEEGEKEMGLWRAWMGEIGDKLVNPGAPLGMSKTVSNDGVTDDGGSNPISGYSIVKVGDMDAALAIAKGCPILRSGGSVEVAEVYEM